MPPTQHAPCVDTKKKKKIYAFNADLSLAGNLPVRVLFPPAVARSLPELCAFLLAFVESGLPPPCSLCILNSNIYNTPSKKRKKNMYTFLAV